MSESNDDGDTSTAGDSSWSRHPTPEVGWGADESTAIGLMALQLECELDIRLPDDLLDSIEQVEDLRHYASHLYQLKGQGLLDPDPKDITSIDDR